MKNIFLRFLAFVSFFSFLGTVASVADFEKTYKINNFVSFEELSKQEGKLIIVKFWMPGCGPCKKMKKSFEELSNNFGDRAIFVSVNIKKNKQFINQYGIPVVPDIRYFYNGAQVNSHNGVVSVQKMTNIVNSYVSASTL